MPRQIISMSHKELDRYELIQKTIKKELTGVRAAKLLKLSYRQFKRLKKKVKTKGATGLIHGNRYKTSNNKLSIKEEDKIKKLLQKYYYDFKPGFTAEKLAEKHGIKRDPKTIRRIMIKEGFWNPKKKRKKGKHHEWRARKQQKGELVQFDGSYEYWFEDRAEKCCLLASIDDATSEVEAQFVKDEGVFAVFGFWRDYIRQKGKPRAIYTDKFSTYKMNQKVALENHETLTRFQRAMEQLDVEVIAAHSPEAKGRVERLFGTLQDRLIKELRLAGISRMKEANCFLQEEFLPKFNARFSVEAAEAGDLHRKLMVRERVHLDSIFSRQTERTVKNDFTISFAKQWYQLTKSQPVTVCKGDKVVMEEHLDKSIKIRLRGKQLNYKMLPERPKKRKEQPWVLAKTKPLREPYKPAANHPWKVFIPTNSLTKQTVKKGTF